MNAFRSACVLLPLLLLFSGCASTPAKRIEQNQSAFDSFPVAVQARIRGGQIDLGFTPDMSASPSANPSASWSAALPPATRKSGSISIPSAATTANASISTA